ncbi:hypothetical protein SUGI_0534660 [Cryptomeria japonica]|uniref:protein IRX15-LIKE n=1 Tax=Cryptomeria japonica TaxID=3369 RepID=UPI002408F034|nr:protein IRX15-LIKE [Cryptomeria japonica]GLJ27250.1 hypothetical protein SUGI_0534660 [Cryptomeria japonica]
MRTVAKLVVLQSTIQRLHKHGHRLWVLAFISFLTFVSFAAFLVKEINFFQARSFESKVIFNAAKRSDIPMDVIEALVHYAGTNSSAQMSQEEIGEIAHSVLKKRPCNLLVFGLGHESFLWRILNYGGRTVFLDESEMWVNGLEEKHPEMEVYEVQYTTKVSESEQLLALAKEQIKTDCRPVQNLLFSDCKLGLIDLPNDLYKVSWDVILIDGPRGYFPGAPGRMSAIFTASVLGRSKKEFKATDIFVHDFNRQVEKVYSNEFLCRENQVSSIGNLAHYSIQTMGMDSVNFCNQNSTSRAPMTSNLQWKKLTMSEKA